MSPEELAHNLDQLTGAQGLDSLLLPYASAFLAMREALRRVHGVLGFTRVPDPDTFCDEWCADCGQPYETRPGCDPSPECDSCAQGILEAAREERLSVAFAIAQADALLNPKGGERG